MVPSRGLMFLGFCCSDGVFLAVFQLCGRLSCHALTQSFWDGLPSSVAVFCVGRLQQGGCFRLGLINSHGASFLPCFMLTFVMQPWN